MTVETFAPAVPQNVLHRALALTSASASSEAYALIAEAARLGESPPQLLQIIADRTGVDLADLKSLEPELQRVALYPRASEPVALALDVLADSFASGGHLRRLPSGELWTFSETHWAPLPLHSLRAIVTRRALQDPAIYGGGAVSVINQATTLISSLAIDGRDLMTTPPPPVINTPSAEIWISKTGAIDVRRHRPESALRHVLPVVYEHGATCPQFVAAILEIFAQASDPPAMAAHFEEVIAYGLQPVRDLPTMLFLRGGGANGKSTLLKIVMAMAGDDQVHAGSIEKFRGDKFVLPELAGKLFLIDEDARDGASVDEGLAKQLSENSLFSTRRAHSSRGFRFISTVMPVIALNGALTLTDSSHGLERRVRVIPFDRRFRPAEMDHDLAQRIIAEELPGVLNRMIAAIQRLRARGGFVDAPGCGEAKASLLTASDPLRAFLEEEVDMQPGAHARLSDMYAAMATWAKRQQHLLPFGRNVLKSKLEGRGHVVRKTLGHAVVEGLSLRK